MAYSSTRGKRERNLMQLMPPDYEISPQLLLDGYMEKQVKVSFLFTVNLISISFSILNCNNTASLLSSVILLQINNHFTLLDVIC